MTNTIQQKLEDILGGLPPDTLDEIYSELYDVSITVQLPKDNRFIPGIYSFILKALAWEGISIIEVVSTCNEFTIILMDKDSDSAFSIIKRIFKS